MVLKKTTLANGIRILTQNIPHYRSVSMGVWVNAGALALLGPVPDKTPCENLMGAA